MIHDAVLWGCVHGYHQCPVCGVDATGVSITMNDDGKPAPPHVVIAPCGHRVTRMVTEHNGHRWTWGGEMAAL